MREKTFRKLVNLYLDSEITPRLLRRLRREIDKNAERKKIFDDYVQLHWALRLAEFDGRTIYERTKARSWRMPRAGLAFGAAAAAIVMAFVSVAPRLDGIQSEKAPLLSSNEMQAGVVPPVDPAVLGQLPDLDISWAGDSRKGLVSDLDTHDLLGLVSDRQSAIAEGARLRVMPEAAQDFFTHGGQSMSRASIRSLSLTGQEFSVRRVSLP